MDLCRIFAENFKKYTDECIKPFRWNVVRTNNTFRTWHSCRKYYASEVDKFAIKATMQNFPDTIQLGDVRELDISLLDKIDLIIGGSPCTNLSMSGKRKGLSTKEGMEVLDLQTYLELKENGFEFEGQSYLFWEYIRIYHELIERGDNPKFFLENVEMGNKWESVFNETMGRKGIHINSALVSAQNRKRIYWTDIHDDIPQPEDRGILLKDILEEEVDENISCLTR